MGRAALLVVLGLCVPDGAPAQEPSPLEGRVLARSPEGLLQVGLEAGLPATPRVGDEVRFSTEMAGRTVGAGEGRVVEVGEGFVWVRVERGRPGLTMTASVFATGPPPPEPGGASPGRPSSTGRTSPRPSSGGGSMDERAASVGMQVGSGDAYFGVVDLRGGFRPDPQTHYVRSGGGRDASALGSGCVGWVGAKPDLIVDYSSPYGVLKFYVDGKGGDTSLLVRGPDGGWRCSDDDVGLDPLVVIDGPGAGRYEVWVGSYLKDFEIDTEVQLSELTVFPPLG